jgi:hypothetical protein
MYPICSVAQRRKAVKRINFSAALTDEMLIGCKLLLLGKGGQFCWCYLTIWGIHPVLALLTKSFSFNFWEIFYNYCISFILCVLTNNVVL